MAMMSEFAVRAFQSWTAMTKAIVTKPKGTPYPIAIVVDCDANMTELDITDKVQFLEMHLPDTARLFWGEQFSENGKNDTAAFMGRLKKAVQSKQQIEVSEKERLIRFKDLVFDRDRFTLAIEPSQEPRGLPLKEARILSLLLESPGACVSRHELLQHVWEGVKISPRTIDSHISRLRKRFETSEVQLESIYGGGYLIR